MINLEKLFKILRSIIRLNHILGCFHGGVEVDEDYDDTDMNELELFPGINMDMDIDMDTELCKFRCPPRAANFTISSVNLNTNLSSLEMKNYNHTRESGEFHLFPKIDYSQFDKENPNYISLLPCS